MQQSKKAFSRLMRALLQRVSSAQVKVKNKIVGAIDKGLLVFLGVTHKDSKTEAEFLAKKIAKLRIFNDSAGKMNLSIKDIGGALLVVSQFTLYANARKGNRPNYMDAAAPEHALSLYGYFQEELLKLGLEVSSGEFGASMEVSLLNEGPVTVLLDTNELLSLSERMSG